jgi:hypothetical protein
LPRFIDVTSDAHIAAVKGAAGGLGSAVALGHAQWVANQENGAAVVTGFGDGNMVASANGWLLNSDGALATPNPLSCLDVWRGSMLNPPSVVGVGAGNGEFTTVDAGDGSGVCTYTYDADNSGIITYNSTNGSVVITGLP